MQEEIEFEKYRKRGAYHWAQYFGSPLKTDTFLRGRYQVVIHLLKRAGITKTSSVLEVGCGDGALSGLICKTFGCKLTGVEPSEEGIRFCKEMFAKHGLQGTFEISGGYQFAFPDQHFDFIVLADVIEHLQHPDLMLKELRRLLKPGGALAVTTPVRTSEHPEDTMHVREFFPGELIRLGEPHFGEPLENIYTHPVVWHELYSYGKKRNRSIIRFYCRVMDTLFGRNVFFTRCNAGRWLNYKQQGLLFRNRGGL